MGGCEAEAEAAATWAAGPTVWVGCGGIGGAVMVGVEGMEGVGVVVDASFAFGLFMFSKCDRREETGFCVHLSVGGFTQW